MIKKPQTLQRDHLGRVIADRFPNRESITCYVGSNAATPTTLIEALTEAIKAHSPRLPFMRMVHLLLQGPIPYLEEGLQDRVMAYSIFSGGEVRKAANQGRAYYLPCTLANLDSLIGPGEKYQPDVAVIKAARNPQTGEYSLGLSVEAIHTAIDHARIVVAELDPSMPFTQGHSVVDASSIDYLVEYGAPIIAVKSITDKGDSKIVFRHPPGISLTAFSYDGVVIVTEYGIADLRGLTTGNKAVAIASIAHPRYRDDLLRQVIDDPFFTKPFDFRLNRAPYGVTHYAGSVPEPEIGG